MQLRKIMVFLLVMTSLGNLKTQPPRGNFYIKGKVVEETSKGPMEYVSVAVYSQRDSSLVSGTITNSNGDFEINTGRAGKFYLTADFVGFERYVSNSLVLKPGQETQILDEISIKPSSLDIDEVEVVAEKSFLTYQIDKKVVEVSKNPLAQGGTAVDALENVPSVETDMEGNVSVRGSTSFTVLIDGRQSPLSGSDALNQIPASAIDKIEIITNPSAKYDPDGTAGIINIISKKGKLEGHSFVANASIGSSPMYSFDASYSYRMKKVNVYAGMNYRNFQMDFTWTEDRFRDSVPAEKLVSSYRNGLFRRGGASLRGGFDYFLTNSNTMSVSVALTQFLFGRSFNSKVNSTTLSNLDTYQLSSTGFEVDPYSVQFNIGDKHTFKDNSEHFLSADLTYQLSSRGSLDEIYSYFANADWENQGFSSDPEQATINGDESRVRLEIDYSNPITEKIKLEAGYSLRVDRRNQDYSRFIIISSLPVPNSGLNDNSEFSRDINAAWMLVSGKLGSVGYSFGIRGEYTNRTIKTEKDASEFKYDSLGFYPSIALSKEWEGGHQLQANYSRRVERPRDYHLSPFPSLNDGYTAFKRNPELIPENANSVELNYQKSWGRNFIALETFGRHTKNRITRVFEPDSDSLLVRTIKNLGYDLSIGAELTANLKLSEWWSVNPGISYYYYELNGVYNGGETRRSSYNSRASLTNNFALSKKTRLQLMGYYRSPSVSLDGQRDASYWLSAAARQEFLDRKLSIVLRVDDIFSTRKRISTIFTNGMRVESESFREGLMVFLSASYRFNQSNNQRGERRRNGDSGGGEVEMDF